MANKVLTLDFDIGTGKLDSGIATVVKKVQSITNESSKQVSTENELSSILLKRADLLAAYSKSLSNIAASKLDEINKERSLLALTEQYNSKLREQAQLQNELKNLVFAQNLGLKDRQASTIEPVKAKGTFSYATGSITQPTQKAPVASIDTTQNNTRSYISVAESRLAADKAATLAYNSFVEEQDKLLTVKHKQELEKRQFDEKASYNARKALYASLFDELAAKEEYFSKKNAAAISVAKSYTAPDTRVQTSSLPVEKRQQVYQNLFGSAEQQLYAAKATDALRTQKLLLEEINSKTTTQATLHKNIALHVAEVIGLYRVLNSTINVTLNAIKSVPKVGIELEATFASLASTLGSEAGASSALAAITKEAERTGIAVSALRSSFRAFQASTSLAGESLDSTWKMFTNINSVATALHLTIDQTNSVFLALAQIFNKTKVQSEELVKQLGNLLPGAFASFSAANRDMFKNSADLIAKMKLGVVTAHDTVEKFTSYLANRFNSAFNIASQGLNSNIGRMQTSFTLLGEAIYSTTRGPMIDFVKGITSIVNYITEGVKGTNSLGTALEQLALVSIAGVIGAVGSMVVKFVAAQRAIVATEGAAVLLGRSLALLSTPTAIIAGIALIGEELYKLRGRLTSAEEEVKTFFEILQQKKTGVSEADKIKLEVDASPAVEGTKKALEAINAVIQEREKIVNNTSIGSFTGAGRKAFNEAKTQLKLNYAERTALEEELERQRAISLEQLEVNNVAKSAEALDAWATKRKQLEVAAERARGNEIAAARLQAEEQYKSIVEEAQKKLKTPGISEEEVAQAKKVIEDYNQVLSNAGVSKESKKNLKEARDDYKEVNALIRSQQEQTKTALEEEQANYDQNIISFDEFYKRKIDILTRSFESEKALQREIGRKASSVGDSTKQVDSEEKIKQLSSQYEADLKQLEESRFAASIANTQQLRALTLEYYTTVGDNEKATKIQLEDKYNLIEVALKNQIDAGKTSAQVDLDHITILKTMAQAEASVVAERIKINEGNSKYEQGLNRINILKNVGALSELEAAIQIKALNEDKIALKEKEIAIEEKLLAVIPSGEAAFDRQKEKIRSLKEELQQFELTANTVGDYFKQTLSPAMANAFVGFVSGTMTAKDAFKSFATSILQEVAKIAAQRLATEIIGGLLSLAGSAASGTDSFGANSSGRIVSAVPQANGGVNTGMGAGNGMILSSPTYFPNARPTMFASGGVVAGEAGHEAVLPLKRTKSGKLGVMVEGNSGGGITIQTMNISVQSKDDASSEEQANLIGKAIKNSLRTMVQQEIASSKRSGGQLNPTQLATSL